MRRSLLRPLTLQAASFADDGLQVKPSWAGGVRVSVELLPASKSDVELAGLRGERVTHRALVPRGVLLGVGTHRFLDGAVVFRLASVVVTPRASVCVLEAVS